MAVALISALCFMSCGGPDQSTPEATVQAYYEAMVDQDVTRACSLIAPFSRNAGKACDRLAQQQVEFAQKFESGWELRETTYSEKEQWDAREEGASMGVLKHAVVETWTDNGRDNIDFKLVEVDGVWHLLP